METTVLTWHGPFTFRAGPRHSVFVGDVASATGLYLWAVPTPQGFLVHRVGGTAKPFWIRQHEHLQAFHRGEYPIHRVAALAAGRRHPVHHGVRGHRGCPGLLESRFHQKQAALAADLEGTLSLLTIFLAPLGAGLRVRRRIETAIILRLRAAGRQESAFLDRANAMCHRLATEPRLRVSSVTHEKVRGLAGEFEA